MDAVMESRVREMEELILNEQFSEVENIWLEAIEEGFEDVSPFLHLAEMMTKANQGDKAAGMLQILIDPLIEKEDRETACIVANAAAKAGPTMPSVKDTARKAYLERFKDVKGIEEVLEHAESHFGHNPSEFAEYLESRCSYRIGDYLFHDAGWGLGKVVGLDLLEDKLIVDFEGKEGHEVALKAVTNFFRKLPAEHLLARKAEDLAAVKLMSDEEPAALIKCAMQSLEGKINLRRIKDLLIPDVIAKTSWSKWWNAVKADMTRNGQLRVGSGTNPVLELLHIPTTLEDEYADKLAACHTPVEYAHKIREYLHESAESDTRAEFLDKQMRKLFDLVSDKDMIPVSEKLLGKFLLDDIQDEVDGFDLEYPLDVKAIANKDEDVINALEGMGIPVYEQRLLKIVEEERDNWPEVYVKALLARCPDSWTYITNTLREAGETEILHKQIGLIYDHGYKETEEGKKYAAQFMWLAPQIVSDGTPADFGLSGNSTTALNEYFRLGMDIFHRIERGEKRAKALLITFRAVLAKTNNKMVRVIAEGADEKTATHILHAIQTNRALSEARIESLSQIIFDIYPELELAGKEQVDLEDEETGEILTTAAGIQRKRQELNNIMNVEIPKIQKAIGEALALGDISENAELDAARAKEDVLRSQAGTLTSDLDRARVVKSDEVDASVAGFGTKVSIQNAESNQTEEYTILGRWDAASEKGIISDISAIGRGLKGAAVGEERTFTTPDGNEVTYVIKGLAKAEFAD